MSVPADTPASHTLQARVASGAILEPGVELGGEYRGALQDLLQDLLETRLATAYGCAPFMLDAPDAGDIVVVSSLVHDRTRHAARLAQLLASVGGHPRKVIGDMDERVRGGVEDVGASGAARWRPTIFTWPLEGWLDFLGWWTLSERASSLWVASLASSSWGPLGRLAATIAREDASHMAAGNRMLRQIARHPSRRAELERMTDRWFTRSMEWFEQVESPRTSARARWRLQPRSEAELRSQLHGEVRELCRRLELTPPAWITSR